MAKGNEKPLQNGRASSTQGTSLPSQLYSKEGFINDAALKYYEVGKGALNSLSQGTSRPEKERVNIGEDAVNSVKNKNIGMHKTQGSQNSPSPSFELDRFS
jgi:hypothetical protein